MTVTYNGTATAPFAVNVVPNSFGTFGINSAGSGPGVLTNAITAAVNTISSSAEPGQMWDIWGTGLGAAPFADNDLPVVQDLGYDVKVYVGGQLAQVVYAGRSGCCSGVDQIRFVVPAGLSGCYVPVSVVVEGVPSNFTSMSIAPGGGACSDPGGLNPEALADGNLTAGIINLSRTSVEFDISGIPGIPQSFNQVSEAGSARYARYDANSAVRQSLNNQLFTQGACTVFNFSDEEGTYNDPVQPIGLDAGPQATVTASGGTRTMNQEELGDYIGIFSLPSSPFPFLETAMLRMRAAMGEGSPEQSAGTFFGSGSVSYSAPGGADVGAHSKSIDIGNPLNWTNKAQVNTIVRSAGQTVTWTPFDGEVAIWGTSLQRLDQNNVAGSAFWCLANAATGSFTLDPNVLQLLPASETFSEGGFSFETGTLSVGKFLREQCQADGLDVCVLTFTDSVNKQLGYR